MKVSIYLLKKNERRNGKSRSEEGKYRVEKVEGYKDMNKFSFYHRGKQDWIAIHDLSGLMTVGATSRVKLYAEMCRLIRENDLARELFEADHETEIELCRKHQIPLIGDYLNETN